MAAEDAVVGAAGGATALQWLYGGSALLNALKVKNAPDQIKSEAGSNSTSIFDASGWSVVTGDNSSAAASPSGTAAQGVAKLASGNTLLYAGLAAAGIVGLAIVARALKG